MSEDSRQRATAALLSISSAEERRNLPEQLLPLVYPELRRLAGAVMRRERPDHTLQPTELVHEVYLKLVDQSRVDWQGRTHFFAVAANAMRRLLVDHARGRGRQKRGGGEHPVTLYDGLLPSFGHACTLNDLITLDDALVELATHDERQAWIIELRVFAGLKVDEVAEVLGVSKRTVEGDWTHGLAWLKRRLTVGAAG